MKKLLLIVACVLGCGSSQKPLDVARSALELCKSFLAIEPLLPKDVPQDAVIKVKTSCTIMVKGLGAVTEDGGAKGLDVIQDGGTE